MKVYLIGAGPGDPGLLTLRGKAALERADVVVYDYLASPAILDWAGPEAERIFVGKRAGLHALPQPEINLLLIKKAQEGKIVARLKGGDPYMFGRGGEEALALLDAGVAFEEIPGVSSTIAGPAYAGIPVTHRSCASSVTIITGHEDADKEASVHDWSALARSASTLVFVMGMKLLPEIRTRLIAGGLSPDTPAAVIHWATTPDQRSLAARLADLPELAREAGFANPSLIVVGEVTRLRDRLNWFEQRPLHGKTVVVTRAREQASDLAAGLEELGAGVVRFPVIAIRPLADAGTIDAAIGTLAAYDWLTFTSVNGVARFWERLEATGHDSRALAKLRIAAIGPATADALKQRGIRADVVPESYKAEDLAAAMLAHGMRGSRVLLARAQVARDALPDALRQAGALVDVLPLYETVPMTENSAALNQSLEAGRVHCVTFGSSSTVDNFFAAVTPAALRRAREQGLRFACIGPITANTLAGHGFDCDIQPERYTIPALIEAVRLAFAAPPSAPTAASAP
jgi:uroporphyrinogen III methyltransferase/synthase